MHQQEGRGKQQIQNETNAKCLKLLGAGIAVRRRWVPLCVSQHCSQLSDGEIEANDDTEHEQSAHDVGDQE